MRLLVNDTSVIAEKKCYNMKDDLRVLPADQKQLLSEESEQVRQNENK